ncbi:MAG TPA: hypothetical protein VIL96_05335, partial [Gaiellaceae bacterium]
LLTVYSVDVGERMAGVGLTDDLARNLLKRLAIAARVAEHGVSLSPRDALLLGDALLRRTLGDVSGEGTVSPTCGDGPLWIVESEPAPLSSP